MSDSEPTLIEELRQESKSVWIERDVMKPNIFQNKTTVHDWRSHVPGFVKGIWERLSEQERLLVMLCCERAAEREEYD
jgi:hypothetical protein